MNQVQVPPQLRDSASVGLILAAGQGRRMGIPKAILQVGSRFLAADHARTLLTAGCASVLFVIGSEADRVQATISLPQGCSILVNADWRSGQLSSLQTGIAALRARGFSDARCLVLPVDTRPLRTMTVAGILSANECGIDSVVPTYGGRRGHPVLLTPTLMDIVSRADPASDRLDHLLSRSRVLELPCNDKAVLSGLNTPGDLARLELALAMQEDA